MCRKYMIILKDKIFAVNSKITYEMDVHQYMPVRDNEAVSNIFKSNSLKLFMIKNKSGNL